MGTQTYLVALGGNVRSKWGSPRQLLAKLMECTSGQATVTGAAGIIETASLLPGQRRYANAVVALETDLAPLALLALLKQLERAYGRRSARRWGPRPLDLDIIAWSGGIWAGGSLSIPHPAFRRRRFVLAPLAEIAPGWRDPVTGLTARQLLARLDRRRPRP